MTSNVSRLRAPLEPQSSSAETAAIAARERCSQIRLRAGCYGRADAYGIQLGRLNAPRDDPSPLVDRDAGAIVAASPPRATRTG
jgi:hypothetical protein